MAMGAADIVPGVSGGTIAFITGIYFRLLEAVSGLPEAAWQHLLKGHFRGFWQACDGTFLICLLGGILLSIATLASAISYALDEHPILIWSFFSGLIVASVWHVSRQVRLPRATLLLPFAAGVVFAWWVGNLSGAPLQPSLLMFFGAGALAICAMILPGISGSFILVILGMYAPVLDSIRAPDLPVMSVFALGCLIGLLSVARLRIPGAIIRITSWLITHVTMGAMTLMKTSVAMSRTASVAMTMAMATIRLWWVTMTPAI
jgi:putative membrane protein